MYLSSLGLVGLLILSLTGCHAKHDPFGQQVQRAAGLSLQGEQSFSQGDLTKASRDFSRALEVSRSVDYPPGEARQLNNLGAVALEQGDLKKAKELFTQAFDINQNQQQWSEASINQANLATVAQKAGNWQDTAQHLQQAEFAAEQTRSPAARGRVLLRWASFHLDQKNPAAAAAALHEAQKLAKRAPSLQGAWAYQKGRLALAQGDNAAALTFFQQALTSDRKVLDRAAMAADLCALGETHQLRGELPQAWESFARAFDVYAALGKKAPLSRCLVKLQEVNAQGQLGNSLERFQKHPRLSSAGGK
jgi:tetratricopeptide (TPR) repeat protein